MKKVQFRKMYIASIHDKDYGQWITDSAVVEKLEDLDNPDYHIDIIDVEELGDDEDSMQIQYLLKNIDDYLGKEVFVKGIIKRPRRKQSDYLFFNIQDNQGNDIQAVIKKEYLGEEKYKKLTHLGIFDNDWAEISGLLVERQSSRPEFFDYEILVKDITKL